MSQSGTYFNAVAPVGTVTSLTGNTGGAVTPTAGNINVLGTGDITVTGNPGTSTLTISTSGGIAETFDTDSGIAVPIAGVIDIAGGLNINTSGATNVVTINLNDTVSITGHMTAGTGFTATTGDVNIQDGSLDLPNTSSIGGIGLINFGTDAFISNYGTNTFVGRFSGNNTLTVGTAINDTGIGNNALDDLTTGANNTALGYDCLTNVTSGSVNTAVGSQALFDLVSGSGNLVLGALSGGNYVGAESYNVLVNSPGVASESNTIRIGVQGSGPLEQDTCYIAGIIGVTVSNPEFVTINSSTGQLGVTSTGGFSDSFTTDSGTATPSSGVINIHGGSNINTSGATNVVTVNLDNTVSISGSMTAATGLTATAGGITATGTSNINTTGSAVTSINTGGTGALNLGNATGNVAVTGKLTASTGLVATAGGIVATGTSNINITGSSITSINTGGTGALNLGNATGNTAVTGKLTASTGLVATTGGIVATGTSTINNSGSGITTIGTGGTGAVNIGNATGNTAITGSVTATGDITITAGNLNLTDTNSAGTVGVITFEGAPWIHDYGSANTFVGLTAGNFSLNTALAVSNTGIGYNALNALTEGFGNTCVGSQCGQLLTTNGANTAIGQAALGNAGEPCIGNTAIGYNALESSTTGIFNCALGYLSGTTYTSESNNLILNHMGQVGDVGVIGIGTQGSGDGQQNTCFIAGITGATVTGTAVLCSTSGQLGTIASSIKYKENVVDILDKSNDILSLRPVIFNYKEDATKLNHYGLIAEEVNEIFPDLVIFNQDDTPYSVAYHELPVLLLNELKKSNARIERLENLIKEKYGY